MVKKKLNICDQENNNPMRKLAEHKILDSIFNSLQQKYLK